MVEAIYASKLYRASTRKDKIQAAWENPINSELVGQLASALDEEYQSPEYLSKEKEPDVPEVEETNTVTDTSEGDSGSETNIDVNVSAPSADSKDPSSIPAESGEGGTSETDPADSSEPSAEVPPSESEPVSTEPVAESSKIEGTAVMGSLPRTVFKNMRQVGDQIKGMLNFKDSTTGVNRVLQKENELWVYYNDSVNLNNVMADVISLVDASGYTYLEFNRLARSDNAIVFQIDFADTQNIVHAVDDK